MAKKIINLDALIPDDTTIIIYQGQEHVIAAATTETYLKVIEQRGKLSSVAPNDEAAMTKQAIDLLCLVIPTLKRDDVLKMPIDVLMKLVDLVMERINQQTTGDAAPLTASDEEVIEGESTLPLFSPG